MVARTPYQPQIDGLRAVAITPVVLFHAGVPGFGNGYLGVDIFFVLSGFLITRLLFAEIKETGQIEFASFYARRVRRLLPALATVVGTTLLLGTFVLSPALEQQDLSKTAIAAMAFVSNFYFWHALDVYYAPSTEWIPLLNMWTLSVEEQFYLIWPLLLTTAAWFGWREGRSLSRITLPSLTGFFAASIALFAWGCYFDRAMAFYLTAARGWEFALGGAIAIAPDRLEQKGGPRGITAVIGLAAILGAIGFLHSFLLSVVITAFGTAAVIADITSAPAASLSRFLQLRPMVVLGRLSYSWYLWHWPLLAFVKILTVSTASLFITLPVSLAALVLAALTFALIEDPVRRRRLWPFLTARQTLATGGTISIAVALLAAFLEVRADLAWPHVPLYSAITAAAQPLPQFRGCDGLMPPLRCVVGARDAPLRIAVWGDSQAAHLLPLMDVAGANGGYAVEIRSMNSCPTVVIDLPVQRGLATECRSFNHAVMEQLTALAHTSLKGIVLTTIGFGFPGPQAKIEEVAAWQNGMQHVFDFMRSLKARVLVIAPIPEFSLELPECLAHGSAEQCGAGRATLETQREPFLTAMHKLAGGYDNVRIWDPFKQLCNDVVCTAVRDGTIMYSNRSHLSQSGARALVPLLTPELDWLNQNHG